MEATSKDKSPTEKGRSDAVAKPFTLADMLEDELVGKVRAEEERATVDNQEERLNAIHTILHRLNNPLFVYPVVASAAPPSASVSSRRFARRGPRTEDDPERKRNLLTSFNYLSTVSGGGYIGALVERVDRE